MDQTIKNGLISGGLWVFGGKTLSLASQLALNALIARLLSPGDMGIYFLIYSLVHLFMMFSLLGMQRSIVRIVSESVAIENAVRARQAVTHMLWIGFFTSIVLAISLYAGVGQFISEKIFGFQLMSELLYLPSIWIVIFTLQTLIAEAFRGYHDIRDATLYNGLVSLIICVPIFFFLWWSQRNVSLQQVLAIIVASYMINLFIALTMLRRLTGSAKDRRSNMMTPVELLNNSWLLYFQNLILFFMTSGQLWLLSYFSTKENVAVYGAVFRLMVLMTSSLAMLRLTILPTIGQLYAKNRYLEVERVLKIAAAIAGIPAVIGLIIVMVFGKSILFILYGSHYADGYSALTVLAIANLINVFTGMPGPLMVMASKEKPLLIITFISSLVGLSLSTLMVGKMDFFGVSIGAGTGIIVHNLTMVWYCKKTLSINTPITLNEFMNVISSIRRKLTFAAHPK